MLQIQGGLLVLIPCTPYPRHHPYPMSHPPSKKTNPHRKPCTTTRDIPSQQTPRADKATPSKTPTTLQEPQRSRSIKVPTPERARSDHTRSKTTHPESHIDLQIRRPPAQTGPGVGGKPPGQPTKRPRRANGRSPQPYAGLTAHRASMQGVSWLARDFVTRVCSAHDAVACPHGP
jgi:hypothetical protein